VGHSNPLEPTLLITINLAHADFQPIPTLYLKISVGNIFEINLEIDARKINLFFPTFILELVLKVLVRGLQEDLGENPGSLAHIISTLTRQLVWLTLTSHPH
jgi:hypothetical protein